MTEGTGDFRYSSYYAKSFALEGAMPRKKKDAEIVVSEPKRRGRPPGSRNRSGPRVRDFAAEYAQRHGKATASHDTARSRRARVESDSTDTTEGGGFPWRALVMGFAVACLLYALYRFRKADAALDDADYTLDFARSVTKDFDIVRGNFRQMAAEIGEVNSRIDAVEQRMKTQTPPTSSDKAGA